MRRFVRTHRFYFRVRKKNLPVSQKCKYHGFRYVTLCSVVEHCATFRTNPLLLFSCEKNLPVSQKKNLLFSARQHGVISRRTMTLFPKCFSLLSILLLLLRTLQFLRRPGQLSRYSDSLRAGRSGDRIPVWARFSAPVQTGPGGHPASCTMGTGSFPRVKRPGRGANPSTPIFSAEVLNRVEL